MKAEIRPVMARQSEFGLTTKFIAPLLIVIVLTLALATWIIFDKNRAANDIETELAIDALKAEQAFLNDNLLQKLESKADTVGNLIALTAVEFVLNFDFPSLINLQENAQKDLDIAYVKFLKPNDELMVQNSRSANPDKLIEKRFAISSAGTVIGHVVIGMATDAVLVEKENSNARIKNVTQALTKTGHQATTQFLVIMIMVIAFVIIVISIIMVAMFKKLVLRPLKEASSVISHLAQGRGDLTVRLPVHSQDEIGLLSDNVNQFIAQLNTMIKAIVADVAQLNKESQQLSTSSHATLKNADEQNMHATRISAALEEMQAAVNEVSRSTSEVASKVESGEKEATQGKATINETVMAVSLMTDGISNTVIEIEQLKGDVQRISGVLSVINDIADLTNLLALNASIEAARAGEHGRGFAVVADEVRQLASRTQQSTHEISETLKQLQQRTDHTMEVSQAGLTCAQSCVTKAEVARISLQTITDSVSMISDMSGQIATATEQQSAVAKEVAGNVHSLKQISDEVADSARSSATASQTLADLATRLGRLTGQFKI